jgi:bifunctional non-homologous end joining protein LigD
VSYIVFDVLAVEGLSTLRQPFRQRRAILEALKLDPPALVGIVYDDGEALLQVVGDRGMEGVVAKRWSRHYRPACAVG